MQRTWRQETVPAARMPALTGDTTMTAGTTSTVTAKVNGVAYPAAPSTNTVPVVTGANTITYEAVPVAAGGTGATSFANFSAIASNGSGNQVAVPGSLSNSMLQWTVTGPTWSSASFPSSTTASQLLYSSAANVVGGLATANNSVLTTNGTGVPSFAASLPATMGGTGQTTYTVGDTLYASTTTALSKLAAGTNGYVLTSGGPGVAPSWQAAAGGGLSGAGTTGYLPYYSAASTLAISPLFTTGGNVGIGTTTPAGKLDVVGGRRLYQRRTSRSWSR